MNGAFDDHHNRSNNAAAAAATTTTTTNERVIVDARPDAATSSLWSLKAAPAAAAAGDLEEAAGAAAKATARMRAKNDDEDTAGAIEMAMEVVVTTSTTTTTSTGAPPPDLMRWVSSDDSTPGPTDPRPPSEAVAAAPASAAAGPHVPHPRAQERGDNLAPSPRRTGTRFDVNDVLFGRGGLVIHNPGNKKFVRYVRRRRPEYVAMITKSQKAIVVEQVIYAWRTQDPPGRFLRMHKASGLWIDACPAKVKEKVSQAFRDAGRRCGAADDEEDHDPYPIDRAVGPDGDAGGAWDPTLVAHLLLVTSGDAAADDEVVEEAEPEPPAAGAPHGGTSVQAQIKPREQMDCVLGSEGQSDSIEGTREFWELASRDKARYRSCAVPAERKGLARNLVLTWHARQGRFLQCAKVTKTRTCSWTVATESDAVAMVHRFMWHDWVINKDEYVDYLFGKGGEVINHSGSKRFRATMDAVRPSYIASGLKAVKKRDVARGVIQAWRAQGGRFLHKDKTIGLWYEVDDGKILTMVQTYLSRNKDKHRAQLLQQQQQEEVHLPPSPVASASCSTFAQTTRPAYTSLRVSGGTTFTSIGMVGSSASTSTPTSSSISASASTAQPDSTRSWMAALASRAGRLLAAPLLCLFGRGRGRGRERESRRRKQGPS